MDYALKLGTNGNVTRIPFPKNHDFKWYSEQIGCEWIEIVRPRGYDYVLIVDEEGLLKNNKINPIASVMYGFFEHGQPIVGDVLLMKEGLKSGELDLIGMTDKETAEAAHMILGLRDKAVKK